jgi:probable F420-dependent oxidoreductase
MKLATMINSPAACAADAANMESLGYDALFANESKHDPFIKSTLIADRTQHLDVVTYITVAFARSPMLAAVSANDVNHYSKGRFTFGIASQIRPHITRRYNMPWSHPARRMKEYIQAMHAIWDTWYEGKPLQFEGEFYNFNLMTPMFTPLNTEYGRPKVMLGAVGPLMTKTAAEIADGMFCHSFTTEKYLREVTLPTIDSILEKNGRSREDFGFVGMPYIAWGDTDEALADSIEATRKAIAFYLSTPAYRTVLELHGWEGVHPEAHKLSKQGKWDEMGSLVTDDMLDAFAVVGTAEACGKELNRRFDGIFDMVCGYTSGVTGMDSEVMLAAKSARENAWKT